MQSTIATNTVRPFHRISLAFMLVLLQLISVTQAQTEQRTGTLIVGKLPPAEMYAHENKMVSTLDYDDSAAASKARVEWARKNSTVWVTVDDRPKQKVTTTASATFEQLALEGKHVVTFYSKSGERGISFKVDFGAEKAEKLKLDYSPGYGNWRVMPVRSREK
jgi:hypothetical protein